MLSYVVITPARNEEAFIEGTIRSMVRQTVLPLKWVIVSDGSTDRTDAIVGRYLAAYPWMTLRRMPERPERSFSGKARSFNAGLADVSDLEYAIVGNLDADLSFGPDVFEFLLARFAESPALGVAGVPFTEGHGTYDYRFSSRDHVSGACQMFRRECYEAIGGYVPMPGGGIDVRAVLTARMKGWETRTFPERTCFHHRPMGAAETSTLRARFALGRKDYVLGGHPAWQCARAVHQMRRHPVVVGGLMILAGYAWAAVRRVPKTLPEELVHFRRREQLSRLTVLRGILGPRRRGVAGKGTLTVGREGRARHRPQSQAPGR